tara:strand:- start:651 stop:1376 length:726 start_codon:yes stop_codon:yes gene_type:complete
MANKSQLYKYKGNRCSGCGMPVEEMVARHGTFKRMFAFHHINPKNKDENYNNLMKRTLSIQQIDEVEKCALVCTHCHDVLHAQEITGSMKISVEVENRTVTQNFNGWFKLDNLDKTLTFISNEKIRLQVCRVNINNSPERLLCVSEIEHQNNLPQWFKDIQKLKNITIHSASSNKLLMSIEYVKNKTVKVSQAMGFPVTAIDFKVEEGDTSFIWFRNGIGLTKEGEVISNGTLNYVCELID